MTKKQKLDVYEIVTNEILDLLDQGIVPWEKPWYNYVMNGVSGPMNLVSKRAYRGINVILLANKPYTQPYWLTFKQCSDLGGKVRKGEKGTMVIFWKIFEREVKKADGDIKVETIPYLRYYKVFNVEQCEGLEEKIPVHEKPKKFNPIKNCEAIMKNWDDAPKIMHEGNRAYYSPLHDAIIIPKRSSFKSGALYYGTLFHESVHSTGRHSRLDRPIMNRHGDELYSKEELVAEMGAAFLCGMTGIKNETIKNSAAYIDAWRKALNGEDNRRMVVCAASAAQKAVDYITGNLKDSDDNNE